MTRPFRILSIDGGGIRGVVAARVLVALEDALKELSGDPEARVAEHFDLVAGTSTGGILAALLLCPDPERPDPERPDPERKVRPRFSARDALTLYLEHGAAIFDRSVWQRVRSGAGLFDEKYASTGLERTLQAYFGDVRIDALVRPCVIPAYDIEHRQAFFFRQHRAKHAPSHRFLLRDVARATSAAPTFFECARVRSATGEEFALVDGGVFANNPALCAYAEAHKLRGIGASDMAILSLGTGTHEASYRYEDAKDWGVASWIRPLVNIMLSGSSEVVDFQLRQVFDTVGRKTQYLRIDAELGAHQSEIDNVDPSNLVALEAIGAHAARSSQQDLKHFLRSHCA